MCGEAGSYSLGVWFDGEQHKTGENGLKTNTDLEALIAMGSRGEGHSGVLGI